MASGAVAADGAGAGAGALAADAQPATHAASAATAAAAAAAAARAGRPAIVRHQPITWSTELASSAANEDGWLRCRGPGRR